jgi:hypothetical protein
MSEAPAAVAQISYPDLYARWERGYWSATEIDLTTDRKHWHAEMSEHERRAALWTYAMFFHGEHSVAATLSPFIDAAPRPEQKYFLATQQADEARHAVLFGRFMTEVVGEGPTVEAAMAATAPHLPWGFRRVFERLNRLSAEMRREPTQQRLVAGVMLYHLVIEAAMAQPGQHLIEAHLQRTGLLPGLFEGMRNISRDEQRHIGFGVKMLSELREVPGGLDAAAGMLREVMPLAAAAYVPPGWDESYAEVFGYTLEDVYADSIDSLETKLRSAGLPPEGLFGAYPQRTDLPPRERARRLLTMLRANLAGEKQGPARRDEEATALLFDAMRLSIDHREAPPRPVTIEWDFEDHVAWHMRVANGSSTTAPGHAAGADLVLRSTFQDWVDIAAGRRDARLAMLTRRLRLRGDMRLLLRFGRMFGR